MYLLDIKIVPLTSENYSSVVRNDKKELPDESVLRRVEKKASSDTVLYNFGVISEGEYVGYGRFVSGTWDPVLKAGHAEMMMIVNEEWRNKGIGRMSLQEIEQLAEKNHIQVLHTNIQDSNDMDLEWFKQKGFEVRSHIFESQLVLNDFNNDQYHFNELEALGIHFKTLSDFEFDEGSTNRFWDLYWSLVADVPGVGDTPRQSNERMNSLVEVFDKHGFILALDGEKWIGLTMILNESDDCYYNSMTGVVQDYRGKGIALALKLKAIEYAQNNNGKYIRTNNDSNNASMLAVNKKLGYEAKSGFFSLVKNVAKVASTKHKI